ncbi:hypothetical protein [Oscillibacter sp.]|uniref:hypothetical protein n=1 Tax=Oscillibacter sp. TaxID=1945593 RepID=UPI0028A225E3|nr:hypothetical protein [Oscillibacter sp.]
MNAKKYAALFLSAALLIGCGDLAGVAVFPAVSNGELAEAVAASPQEDAVDSAEMMNAAETTGSARELTEEEVLAAYDRAVAAYEWFELNPLPCVGPVRQENGVKYQRVDYVGLYTLDDLETYLESLFSEDVIARLLDRETPAPRYRDIDGALYARPDGRPADTGKGAATAAVEREEDGSYLINVTVDLLDRDQATVTGAEFYAFPYRELNGRWVFADFDLVY